MPRQKQKRRAGEKKRTPGPVSMGDTNPRPSTRHQPQADEPSNESRSRRSPIGCATLVAVLFTMMFTGWQAYETRRGVANVARQAAVAARAWVTVARTQLAVLVPGRPAVVLLHVTNSGQSPAINLRHMGSLVGRAEQPSPADPEEAENPGEFPSVLGPGATFTLRLETTEPVTGDYLAALQAGRSTLFAGGLIFYQDIFGQEHITDFCFQLKGSELLNRFPTVNEVGISIIPLANCPSGNRIRY